MIKAEVYQLAAFRHAQFYLGQLQIAQQHLNSGNDLAAFRIFDEHWMQILCAFTWLSRHEDDLATSLCNQYVTLSIDFLRSRRPISESIEWLNSGVEAARRSGTIESEIRHLIRLGDMYIQNKSIELSRTVYQQALTMANAIGSREEQAWAQKGLGNVLRLQHPDDQARQYLHSAIDIFREIDNPVGAGQSLQTLGSLEEMAGNLSLARQYLEQAMSYFQKLDDLRSIAMALCRMGSIAERAGDYAQALAHLERALEIAQRIGDDTVMSTALITMGLIEDIQGDKRTAKSHFEQALYLCTNIGHHYYTGTVLINLGWIATDLHEYEEALRYHQQAEQLYRSLQHRRRTMATLCNMTYLHIQLNQLDQARQTLLEGLTMTHELFDISEALDLMLAMGWLCLRMGDAPYCARIVGMMSANPPKVAYPERQAFLDMVMGDLQTALSDVQLQPLFKEGALIDPVPLLDEMLASLTLQLN